jgi:hypothetical protein
MILNPLLYVRLCKFDSQHHKKYKNSIKNPLNIFWNLKLIKLCLLIIFIISAGTLDISSRNPEKVKNEQYRGLAYRGLCMGGVIAVFVPVESTATNGCIIVEHPDRDKKNQCMGRKDKAGRVG